MAVVAMKQLLEAGVHFGHQTKRWDPKMAEYIYQARNGIHIIDLQKTSKKIDEAYKFIKEVSESGADVLFVGTKKQAQECIKEAAIKSGQFYVDQRWLGGMLTNFKTIRKRVDRLKALEVMEEDGTFEVLPKKEVAQLRNEREKLEKHLGGIKDMLRLPGAMFVVDPKNERIAVLEARKLNIPLVGLIDTNCNPGDVDYPIPGNDDAIRAVKLITDVMANAIIEGRQGEAVGEVISEEEEFAMEEVAAELPKDIEEVVEAEEEEIVEDTVSEEQEETVEEETSEEVEEIEIVAEETEETEEAEEAEDIKEEKKEE